MTHVADMELEGSINYLRQRDWYDPTKSTAEVSIVGCGGIGSPTALALSKLGIPKLALIDPDTIEPHNLPNQIFPLTDKGKTKVDALKEVCESFGSSKVETFQSYVDAEGFQPVNEGEEFPANLRGVVISALDSMEAREFLWKQVRMKLRVPLFVDARLGGESIVVYTCNPSDTDDIKRYEETLHSDEEAREDTCTRQSIIDVGFVVASLITRAVRRHLTGLDVEHTVVFNQDQLWVGTGKE